MSDDSEKFRRPACETPVRHGGRSYELYVTVEVEPNFDTVEYWSVVLHFTTVDEQTHTKTSHNIAKIEFDRTHEAAHIHRNYRRDQPRDFDIDVDGWVEAMDRLKENARRYFASYADTHL